MTAVPPDVRRDGQVVEVRAAGKKLAFAARTAEAVEMLLSGRPVSLPQARQSTGIDVNRIAEVLLRRWLPRTARRVLFARHVTNLRRWDS